MLWSNHTTPPCTGLWTFIWNLKIPPKVKFFLWQCAREILPTLSLLHDRGIDLNATCKWCNTEEEDLGHLFQNCQLAKMAWNIFTMWTGTTLSPQQPYDFLSMLKSPGKKKKGVGAICKAAMLWSIWLARNDNIYKNKKNFIWRSLFCHQTQSISMV